MSLVNQALEQIQLNPDQAVYTISVPGVGYDLVLPNNEAKQLENVEQLEVEKEDRQGPIMVNAWPGRGDVPPANQWGDDWAVVIPS
mgnify:CR=1 FL=1